MPDTTDVFKLLAIRPPKLRLSNRKKLIEFWANNWKSTLRLGRRRSWVCALSYFYQSLQ
jgi:hypothetical protein